jgi:hypothetical protein
MSGSRTRRNDRVKYILMIYQNTAEWEALPEAERNEVMAEAGKRWEELATSGEWISGEGLGHPSTAKTVRVRGGKRLVTDGPFVDSKEHIGGILVLDCETEERAVEIAASWPDARYWAMEVRPLAQEA